MGIDIKNLEKIIGDENMPIEVKPLNDDEFLVVKETLTRMGRINTIKNGEKNVLNQLCHILHKKGQYYITHFKHMYMFDGKLTHTNLTPNDVDRLKYIVSLLTEWDLVKPLADIPPSEQFNKKTKASVKIIKHSELEDWDLEPKYFNTFNKGND